jgi:hypothetical protein
MKMTEETKNKIRNAMLGKKHSQATRQILKEKMTGKKLSPRAIAKMKASLKRTWDVKLGRVAPLELVPTSKSKVKQIKK